MKFPSSRHCILLIVLSIMLFPFGCTKEEPPTPVALIGGSPAPVEQTDAGPEPLTPAEAVPEPTLTAQTLKQAVAICDFTVQLAQQCCDGGNSVSSPLSLLYALGMTTNGASGSTLAQIEACIGMPIRDLNSYLYLWNAALPQNNGQSLAGTLHLANSVWIKDDFETQESFLQTTAAYYGAQVYAAAFDDETVSNINQWVSDQTDGNIAEIVDSIPAEALLYLINALTFNAEWKDIYQEASVKEKPFTCEDGTEKVVPMMHSSEHSYLETELSTGFLKPYYNSCFAFAALLPNEGVTVDALLASLTGEVLYRALSEPTECKVVTATPKFSIEASHSMTSALQSLGITEAFDPQSADFSLLASEDVYISNVMQKVYIHVDERGTKAGAVSAVEMAGGAGPTQEEYKTVILNRPFVYLIIDTQTSLPIFIGTVNDPS